MMMYQILCGHVNYALGKTRMQVKNTHVVILIGTSIGYSTIETRYDNVTLIPLVLQLGL
jgi:hypothetical protein